MEKKLGKNEENKDKNGNKEELKGKKQRNKEGASRDRKEER